MGRGAIDGPAGLVYHRGALGDFVLSLPAVFRVLQAHPGQAWSLWGDAERLALLPGFQAPPGDLIRYGHSLWGERPAPEALAALRDLEAILVFGGEAPPTWVAPPGPRLLRIASFPPEGGSWVPAYQARQLNRQGVPRVRVPWLPAWRQTVLPLRRPAEIVLHPGSGDPRKNVPAPLWAEVLAGLREETALPTRLVLGPAEGERDGWQELALHVDAVTWSRSLGDLLGALASAALFLGNDSGTSHLAGILGIPTVVLFGPSDARRWRPLGPRVRVIGLASPPLAGRPGERGPQPDRAFWSELSAGQVVRQALAAISPPRSASGQGSPVDALAKRF